MGRHQRAGAGAPVLDDRQLWWANGGTLRGESVELIDPWAMTIEPLELAEPPYYRYPRNVQDQVTPVVCVELPGRPYLALRVRWR